MEIISFDHLKIHSVNTKYSLLTLLKSYITNSHDLFKYIYVHNILLILPQNVNILLKIPSLDFSWEPANGCSSIFFPRTDRH